MSVDGSSSEIEEDYSDPEDYVDDISDADLLGDILKEKPVEDIRLDNIIVVDNIPKIGPDKQPRLKSILNKIFTKFGTVITEYYPVGDNGLLKGYFFLEYSNAEEAEDAVNTCNGYKLDKSHIFAVNLFTDFEKYADLPDDWNPPEKADFVEIGNLRSWLLNEHCNDQYSVIYSSPSAKNQRNHLDNTISCTSAVYWNTSLEAQLAMERLSWTETYLQWSPMGTYLTTFHSLGVQLWGGDEFGKQARIEHPEVHLVDFSPCERYLVTFSAVVENPNDPQNIVIWDVKTGTRKRSFSKSPKEDWPVIKWSHDGKYFAKKGDNVLSVYEVPSFGLLDKKSIVAKDIKDFAWSPSDNLLAYWIPENNEIPTKIIITKIPSKVEVSTKSRHNVSECKLQWQKQGTFLCVRVDHFLTKSKKQMCSSFEVFHTKESLVPVDNIEVKDPVIAFALEPNGTKLGVIHGEPPTRISVTFYGINEKGNPPTVIKTLEKQSANTIYWSPAGQFVVLAQMKSMDGVLDFIDTFDMTLMNRQEHTKVTDLTWDPTGRYVVSSLSYWTEKMDTGYIVWSFQGKLLYRNPREMERFYQLQWRPRPPSLLTDEDIKALKKDIRRYQYQFEQSDKSTKTKASKGLIEKRQKQLDDFKEFRNRKLREMKEKEAKFFDYANNRNALLADSLEIVEQEVLIEENTI